MRGYNSIGAGNTGNEPKHLFNEEIADEGDMLQSHGMSPPRFSIVSNINRVGESLFSSSRQSEAVLSKPVSSVISPRDHAGADREFGNAA